MLKRIVTLLAVLALLLPCLLVPASAAEVNSYYDYIDRLEVVDDDVLVSLSLPLDDFYVSVYNYTDSKEEFRDNSSSLSYLLQPNTDYSITFVYKWLNANEFPIGTIFNFDVDIYANNVENGVFFEARLGFANDSNGKIEHIIYGTNVLHKPDGFIWAENVTSTVILGTGGYGLVAMMPNFNHLESIYDTGEVKIRLNSCRVQFSLSALQFQVQQDSYSDTLLKDIEKKLDENGQKLDDIINRPANPKPPAGADNVTNAGQKEDQLLNSGAAGREEFNDMLGGSAASLELYTASFAFLSACINPIIDIPWIKEILTISIGLGLTGFLLNLGISAISKAGKDGGKSSGKGGGK